LRGHTKHSIAEDDDVSHQSVAAATQSTTAEPAMNGPTITTCLSACWANSSATQNKLQSTTRPLLHIVHRRFKEPYMPWHGQTSSRHNRRVQTWSGRTNTAQHYDMHSCCHHQLRSTYARGRTCRPACDGKHNLLSWLIIQAPHSKFRALARSILWHVRYHQHTLLS
jgi:hypothetical protein